MDAAERRKSDDTITHLLIQTQEVRGDVKAVSEKLDAFLRWQEYHEHETHKIVDQRLAGHSSKISWILGGVGLLASSGVLATFISWAFK
jgi:hypothetical protein